MISANAALNMASKKLKSFLREKNFNFEFSIEEANKWLESKGHSDLKIISVDNKIKVTLKQ